MFTLNRGDKQTWGGNAYGRYFVRFRIVPTLQVAEMLTFYNSAKMIYFSLASFSEMPEPEVLQTSTQHRKFHHKLLLFYFLIGKEDLGNLVRIAVLPSTVSSESSTASVSLR